MPSSLTMRPRTAAGVMLFALLVTVPHHGHAVPPFGGTIFLDPDIITESDPTTFTGIAYAGTGSRVMFDRRANAFVTYNAFLFNAQFSDFVAPVEIQVNPEFQTMAASLAEAEKYARVIGRLPTALRTDLRTVWIHRGVQPFGGGNNNLLIHIGQADAYVAEGILEETLVHEAAHTSIDAAHQRTAGWLAAQQADLEFISTYARDFPTSEDIAESFLPYLAVRYRRDRISVSLATTIEATIPNRLRYFDEQRFNLFPLVPQTTPVPPVPPATLTPPTLLPATVIGPTVTIQWTAPPGGAPASYRLEAGSGQGLTNIAQATLSGTQTSATFTTVPAGTYYIRMRSIGVSGVVSGPSNEIVVLVSVGGCQPPAAPQALVGTVDGRLVTLSWELPSAPAATSFDIEAGSASGLADLAIVTVPGSARSFSVVAPPGQYFVRVRARSGCGVGLASNEVVVSVF